MKDGLAARNQVIGHDAPMASPPDGFRAHDRTSPLAAVLDQPIEARMKLFGERVVGVVVEALVCPQTIDLDCHGIRPAAAAAERCLVVITDVCGCERKRQRLPVELRVGSRSWYRPDIGDYIDIGRAQQIDELIETAVGMADGEEWKFRALPDRPWRSRALPLWSATAHHLYSLLLIVPLAVLDSRTDPRVGATNFSSSGGAPSFVAARGDLT